MCAFSCASSRTVEFKDTDAFASVLGPGEKRQLNQWTRTPVGRGCVPGGEDAPEALRLPSPVSVADRCRFREDFKRLSLLGRGAFGEVWRCQSLVDGKEYGVKIIKYRAFRSIEQHVVREAQALSLMSHPNVLRYHDAWIETESRPSGEVMSHDIPNGKVPRPLPCGSPPCSPQHPPQTPSTALGMDTLGTMGSTCVSYDCGSLGSCSGVVFCDVQEEEEDADAVSEDCRRTPTAAKALSPDVRARERSAKSPPPRLLSSGSLEQLPAPLLARQETGQGLFPEPAATLYIQVELCREDTLQGWIERRNEQCGEDGPDRADDRVLSALSIFMECVNALAHVHRRSCVHRDVKPSNILFSRRHGAVRLGDFGLAKVLGGDGSSFPAEPHSSPQAHFSPSPDAPQARRRAKSGLEATRGTVGTPSYASPEQLAGQQLGAATDVYALGLVLAELICPVRTQMERAAVLEGFRARREAPSALTAAFPTLAKLVVQMTEPDPLLRPKAREILRTARQVFRELRKRADPPTAKGAHHAQACCCHPRPCGHWACGGGRWRRSRHHVQRQRAAHAHGAAPAASNSNYAHSLQQRPAARTRGRPSSKVALASAALY